MAKALSNYKDTVLFVQRTKVTSVKGLVRELRLPPDVAEEYLKTMEQEQIVTPKRNNGVRDLVKKSERPISQEPPQLQPNRKHATRKALTQAINPSPLPPPGGEPQIPIEPPLQMSQENVHRINVHTPSSLFPLNGKPTEIIPAEEEDDTHQKATPQSHAIVGEMFNAVTGNQRMQLSVAILSKIKALSENNFSYFQAADVTNQLLKPYYATHPNFRDQAAFVKFNSRVSGDLSVLSKRKIDSTEKVFMTEGRILPAFNETPIQRMAYGYRWGATKQIADAPPPPPAPAPEPVQQALKPIPDHLDITPHPNGEANADELGLKILTMNTAQCNACLSLLLGRMLELQNSLKDNYKTVLENQLFLMRN